jgi:hypothetical protein
MRTSRFIVLGTALLLVGGAFAVVTATRNDGAEAGRDATLVGANSKTPRKLCPTRLLVTVTHGPVTPVALVDNGAPGDSAGDERIFSFDGTDNWGRAVHIDWTMTTTGIDVPEAGLQTRINNGVFSWPDVNSQMTLNGIGVYPNSGSVLAPSAQLDRPLVGGSGQFADANGWVHSDHLPSGDWTHTFYMCR